MFGSERDKENYRQRSEDRRIAQQRELLRTASDYVKTVYRLFHNRRPIIYGCHVIMECALTSSTTIIVNCFTADLSVIDSHWQYEVEVTRAINRALQTEGYYDTPRITFSYK